jgi:hypothetical protein
MMYSDNCYERAYHGDKPYKDYEEYYTKNYNWLKQQFKERKTYGDKHSFE